MIRFAALATSLLCLLLPSTAMSGPLAKEVEVNGVRLQYVEHGSGEPIVFVHGAFSDLRVWEPISLLNFGSRTRRSENAPCTKTIGSPEPCSTYWRRTPLTSTSLAKGPDIAVDGRRRHSSEVASAAKRIIFSSLDFWCVSPDFVVEFSPGDLVALPTARSPRATPRRVIDGTFSIVFKSQCPALAADHERFAQRCDRNSRTAAVNAAGSRTGPLWLTF